MSYAAAYEEYVYPLLLRDCASCHGVSQVPLFASTNVQNSVNVTMNFYNFTNRPDSAMVRRTTDGHCSNQPVCLTNGSEMLAAVEALYDNGVKNINDDSELTDFDIAVPAVAIPARDDLNPTAFLPMQWDLSELGLPGYRFSIEIQYFDEFSYRIRNPKFHSVPNGTLKVGGIRPMVNGHFDPANNQWALPMKTLATTNAGVLFTNFVIVMGREGDGDVLSFAFEVLEK